MQEFELGSFNQKFTIENLCLYKITGVDLETNKKIRGYIEWDLEYLKSLKYLVKAG